MGSPDLPLIPDSNVSSWPPKLPSSIHSWDNSSKADYSHQVCMTVFNRIAWFLCCTRSCTSYPHSWNSSWWVASHSHGIHWILHPNNHITPTRSSQRMVGNWVREACWCLSWWRPCPRWLMRCEYHMQQQGQYNGNWLWLGWYRWASVLSYT